MANIPQSGVNPVPGIPVGVGIKSPLSSIGSQNPLLTPDFDTPFLANGVLTRLSPNDLLGQPGYVRTAASATATVGGTVASGHVLTLKFTNGVLLNSGGPRSVSYTTVGGDTASTAAEFLADAINADPVLRAFGIYATASAAVVTINHPGPVGNFTTVSFTTTGAETCTFSPVSGTLAGGAGSAWPFNGFTYTFGFQTFQLKSRTPVILSQPVLTAMVRDGMPIA